MPLVREMGRRRFPSRLSRAGTMVAGGAPTRPGVRRLLHGAGGGAGARLLLRSAHGVASIPRGFVPEDVVVAQLHTAYSEAEGPVYRRLLDALRADGLVTSAALAWHTPLSVSALNISVEIPGTSLWVLGNAVSADYFRTLGVAVLEGREFTAADHAGSPFVAMVNRTLAERLWPGRPAVGQVLTFPFSGGRSPRWRAPAQSWIMPLAACSACGKPRRTGRKRDDRERDRAALRHPARSWTGLAATMRSGSNHSQPGIVRSIRKRPAGRLGLPTPPTGLASHGTRNGTRPTRMRRCHTAFSLSLCIVLSGATSAPGGATMAFAQSPSASLPAGGHGPDRPRVDDTMAAAGDGYGALTGRPRVRPVRTDTQPNIDGRLDDDVWRTASMLSEFVQQSPLDGAPATEQTEAYIAYDRDHIYFGFYLHYNDAGIMRASRVDRDEAWQDDLITVHLDPFMD